MKILFYRWIMGLAFLMAIQCAAFSETVAPAKPSTSLHGLDIAHQLNDAFTHIAEECSESVVVITVTQKMSAKSVNSDGFDEYEDPWERFRRFFDKDSATPPPEKPTGQGSGIIIRRNGYILTNCHVVQDSEKVEVRLKDGRIFKGEVRGLDVPADVAVIKIDADDLPVAKLGDSDKARIGEFAIAIGAPFSLEYSTTFGHVSAKNRYNLGGDAEQAGTMQDQDFIQTDASINPGNSGGPLVNIDGEVIGINTLIHGIHTGIGFAIPINLAREIAEKLIKDGKFTRAWIGVSVKALRDYADFRALLPNSIQNGVVVSEIVLSSPSAESNLKLEDVILKVDGKPVTNSQQLHESIRQKKLGKNISLDVFRRGVDGGKMLVVQVRPEEWKDPADSSDDEKDANASLLDPLGVVVKTISAELSSKYGAEPSEGVIITKANKSGLAYVAGMQEGDVISSINGHGTLTPRQYREAMLHVDLHKGCIVQFISQGSKRFEIIKSDGN